MARMDGVLPYLARLLAYLLAVILTTTHAATLVYNFTNLPSETVKVMRGVWMQPSVIIWEQEILGDCADGQYESANGTCLECLTFTSRCDVNITGQCCKDVHLECRAQTTNNGVEETCVCKYDYVWENDACTPLSNSVQFMTAAQIALGASLLIAVSALSALTCKMCSSRRRLQELRRYESDAVSLNSVQRFVLRRLRDRPPRYEESTNGMPDKPPAYNEIDSPAPLPTPSVPQVRPVVPLVPQTQTSTSETSENFVTNLHRLLRGYRRSSQPPPVYEESDVNNTVRPPSASFPEPEISIIEIQVPNENPSTINVAMQLSSDVDAQSTSDTDPTPDPHPTTSSVCDDVVITEEQINTEDVQDTSPCEDSKQESSINKEENSRKEIVEEPGGIDNPAFTPDM